MYGAAQHIFALNKAREFQLDQSLILPDSLEVFRAVKGKEDNFLRSCVAKALLP